MRWRALPAIAFGLCAAVAQAETLVVLGGDSFAPTSYLDRGQPAGTLIDILKKVAEKTGDHYEIRLYPWKRAYEYAVRGEGAIVGLSMTPPRQEIFDFSEPLQHNELQLVVVKGSEFPFARLSDLKGRNIGGGSGVSYGPEVDSAIASGVFVMVSDTDASARLQKVLLGTLDAAIIGHGMPGLDWLVKSHPRLQARRDELTVLPKPLARDPLYLATAKTMQKKDALERLNKALVELQRSGQLKVK